MTKKLILIDGTNLAMAHFHANPTLTSDGEPAGIIKGVISDLLWMNRQLSPDKIIIFFDGPGGSLKRRKIYKDYKSGRKPRTIVGQNYVFSNEQQMEKQKDWQLQQLIKLLNMLCVQVIITNNYESDDGISYLSSWFSKGDWNIIISSTDKDFYQLVNDKVSVYNHVKNSEYNTKTILKEHGIHPINWLFYKTICGDKSDNIPGIKGFGEKTLKKFFDLEKEEKLTKEIVNDIITVLKEETLTKSEKREFDKYIKIKENFDLLERNEKIMDLKNPLMSLDQQDKLDYEIKNFTPALQRMNFYLTVAEFGGLKIDPSMVSEFVKLEKQSSEI